MKIVVDEKKKITVMLEHMLDVEDMAWGVIWQRFVQGNKSKPTRQLMYRWAIDNITEGRLYKSHANSEAARNNMKQAMELVRAEYPEFQHPELPKSSKRPTAEA